MTKRPLRRSPWLTAVIPALIGLIAVGFIVVSLDRAIESRRFDEVSKQTLLEIQRALQDFHVAEEIYPRKTPLSGAELVQLLIDTGHLQAPPRNPWTGEPYAFEAPVQPDGIEYRTDELAETYALRSLDQALSDSSPRWQLDSNENHSLE